MGALVLHRLHCHAAHLVRLGRGCRTATTSASRGWTSSGSAASRTRGCASGLLPCTPPTAG
eukprot:4768887-Alexandrium_andersonii.AAC.1